LFERETICRQRRELDAPLGGEPDRTRIGLGHSPGELDRQPPTTHIGECHGTRDQPSVTASTEEASASAMHHSVPHRARAAEKTELNREGRIQMRDFAL
jgi:hypothetical protein